MFKIRQTLAIVAALLLTSLMPASADYVINWILMLTRKHLIGGAAAVNDHMETP